MTCIQCAGPDWRRSIFCGLRLKHMTGCGSTVAASAHGGHWYSAGSEDSCKVPCSVLTHDDYRPALSDNRLPGNSVVVAELAGRWWHICPHSTCGPKLGTLVLIWAPSLGIHCTSSGPVPRFQGFLIHVQMKRNMNLESATTIRIQHWRL